MDAPQAKRSPWREPMVWLLVAIPLLAVLASVVLLVAAVLPLVILLLGGLRILEDDTAMWMALGIDTLILGVLGFLGVARWSKSPWLRAGSALITAAFGVLVVLLKVFVH